MDNIFNLYVGSRQDIRFAKNANIINMAFQFLNFDETDYDLSGSIVRGYIYSDQSKFAELLFTLNFAVINTSTEDYALLNGSYDTIFGDQQLGTYFWQCFAESPVSAPTQKELITFGRCILSYGL